MVKHCVSFMAGTKFSGFYDVIPISVLLLRMTYIPNNQPFAQFLFSNNILTTHFTYPMEFGIKNMFGNSVYTTAILSLQHSPNNQIASCSICREADILRNAKHLLTN